MKYPEFRTVVDLTSEERSMQLVAVGVAQTAIQLAHGRHNDVISAPFVAVLASLPGKEESYRVLATSGEDSDSAILTEEASRVITQEAALDQNVRTLALPEDVVVGGLTLRYYSDVQPSDLFLDGVRTVPEDQILEQLGLGSDIQQTLDG